MNNSDVKASGECPVGKRTTMARVATASDNMPVTPTQNLSLLPTPKGLPVVGHLLSLMLNPLKFLRSAYEQCGEVFVVKLGLGTKAVFLLGPEANEYVLMDRENQFSNRWGYVSMRIFLGENSIITRDYEDHRNLQKVIKNAFKQQCLTNYLNRINQVLGIELNIKSSNIKFYPFIERYSLKKAAHVFYGLKEDSASIKLCSSLLSAVDSMTSYIHLPLPGSKHSKGIKGRDYARRFFMSLLESKRNSTDDDLFSVLANVTDNDGNYLDDRDLIDNLISTFAAAHETSMVALTAMVYFMSKHQDWQRKVRDECQRLYDVTGSNDLSYSDLSSLNTIDMIFKESVRIHAPVKLLNRRTLKQVNYKGNIIPKNSMVAVSPYFTQRMESLFPDPDEFRPERFSAEDNQVNKYAFSWTPFGKGAHTCLGLHFSMMSIKAFMYKFVRKYQFEVPEGYNLDTSRGVRFNPIKGLPLMIKPITGQ